MAERTRNTMVPWDDSFPRTVLHIANFDLELEVVWYGLESTMYGSVPVVAKEPDSDTSWFAGEADVVDGKPLLAAVNAYSNEGTALSYASDRNRIWTL
jgi:hypothetical protein